MATFLRRYGGFVLFGCVLTVILGAGVALDRPLDQPSPQVDSQTTAAAAKAADLQNLAAFHADAAGIATVIERSSASLVKKWEVNALRLDFYALYDAAEEYRDEMRGLQVLFDERYANADHVINDASLATKIKGAKGALAKTLDAQVQSGTVLMRAADQRDLRPSDLAKLRSLREDASGYYLAGTLAIVEAYGLLGIDRDKIDLESGGLKKGAGKNELMPTDVAKPR